MISTKLRVNGQMEESEYERAWQEELSDILSSKEIDASPLYEEAYNTFTYKFDEMHADTFRASDWEKAYYCLRIFIWVISEINECCNPQGDFDEEKAIQILNRGCEMLEKMNREYEE